MNENIIIEFGDIKALPSPTTETFDYSVDENDIFNENGHIEVEYADLPVDYLKRSDIAVAVASGTISGTLNAVVGSKIVEEKIDDIQKSLNRAIKEYAKIKGYKEKKETDSVEKAIKYLINKEKKAKNAILDEDYDVKAYSSVWGLVANIQEQFKEDSDKKVPQGETLQEKLTYAVCFWMFRSLCMMAKEDTIPEREKHMPKAMYNLMVKVVSIPLFKDVVRKYSQKKSSVVEIIGDILQVDINDFLKKISANSENEIFDLSFTASVNEAIVKAAYVLIWMFENLSQINRLNEVKSFTKSAFYADKDTRLQRMRLISYAIYTGIDTAKFIANFTRMVAEEYAAVKQNGKPTIPTVRLTFDKSGAEQLIILVSEEWEGLKEAINDTLNNKKWRKENIEFKKRYAGQFRYFTLTGNQSQILYSIEAQLVLTDMLNTKSDKDRALKYDWYTNWLKSVNKILFTNGLSVISEKDKLYGALSSEISYSDDKTWLYLIELSIGLFEAYFPLGFSKEEKQKYKKLNYSEKAPLKMIYNDFPIIRKDECDSLLKTYDKYLGAISGGTMKKTTGAVAAIALTAATGGLAFAFAPGIAVAIAGGSFTGLYGAALTSASLAALGGGAVAAGGLGMAGGTALITGGGALIGLVGSSGLTSYANNMLVSEGATEVECAKLLTICRDIFIRKNLDYDIVKKVITKLELFVPQAEREIDILKKEEHKDVIKKMTKSLKTIKATINELHKLI